MGTSKTKIYCMDVQHCQRINYDNYEWPPINCKQLFILFLLIFTKNQELHTSCYCKLSKAGSEMQREAKATGEVDGSVGKGFLGSNLRI